MKVIEKETFTGGTVAVDGVQFKGCTFEDVALLYNGGEVPSFTNCQFDGVSLQFGSEAANTLKFLSAVRKRGFSNTVDQMLAQVTAK
jgi:hypothetical protein